jgi:hypothetical protein
METKKLSVFPGCCLGKYADALVEGAADVEMLESTCAHEDDG